MAQDKCLNDLVHASCRYCHFVTIISLLIIIPLLCTLALLVIITHFVFSTTANPRFANSVLTCSTASMSLSFLFCSFFYNKCSKPLPFPQDFNLHSWKLNSSSISLKKIEVLTNVHHQLTLFPILLHLWTWSLLIHFLPQRKIAPVPFKAERVVWPHCFSFLACSLLTCLCPGLPHPSLLQPRVLLSSCFLKDIAHVLTSHFYSCHHGLIFQGQFLLFTFTSLFSLIGSGSAPITQEGILSQTFPVTS